jgi:hypothetical protein
MSMFDDPEVAALMEGMEAGEEELSLPKGPKASAASIEYAQALVERVGYDMDAYDWGNMEQEEASRIIDDCKFELGIE